MATQFKTTNIGCLSAESKIQIIDAHCHVWDLSLNRHPWLAEGILHAHRYGDYSAIKNDFLPQDYHDAAAPWHIAGAVYMEAEWSSEDPLGETKWVHNLNAKTGFPSAMTAQVWLDRSNATDLIAAQAAFPLVRSVRHKPRAFATENEWHEGHNLPGSMRCSVFRQNYSALAKHGLHFELQTPFWHLPDAAELARDYPDITIIVNHTGVPGTRNKNTLRSWYTALSTLAAEPNVLIKIGGLGVPGEAWTLEAQRDVVLTTLNLFGSHRCMFASNMPVDSMFRSFPEIINDFMEITSNLTTNERHSFFSGTAIRTYKLTSPADLNREY